MGKSPLINTIKLQNLARITKSPKPASQFQKEKSKNMENSSRADRDERSSSNGSVGNATRVPLSEVVSDCVKRWFKDTLKEARAGDINMQVLVGQMYYSGYGVPVDSQKGRIWMTRASRTRSSVWKVSDKRPGTFAHKAPTVGGLYEQNVVFCHEYRTLIKQPEIEMGITTRSLGEVREFSQFHF